MEIRSSSETKKKGYRPEIQLSNWITRQRLDPFRSDATATAVAAVIAVRMSRGAERRMSDWIMAEIDALTVVAVASSGWWEECLYGSTLVVSIAFFSTANDWCAYWRFSVGICCWKSIEWQWIQDDSLLVVLCPVRCYRSGSFWFYRFKLFFKVKHILV